MNDTSSGPRTAETPRGNDPDEGESRSQNWGLFGRAIGVISGTQPYSAKPDTSLTSSDTTRPGLLNLRRMRVDDVSIPKAEIVAVPIGTTQDELVKVFRESGLTRIPVFEGTLDTPVGIVNLKDFALRFGFNGKHDDFDLRNILRPLLYVPPSMPLGVLLQKMQAERIHMALVIDEYGGTDGLVTIEDLIEQVVGEIEDEHDVDEATSFIEERPGCWLALAKTPLDEFEPAIGMSLTNHEEIDDEEVETLGGLAFMLAGHVPARGEVIRHPDGPEFEVIDADARRIKRLRVRLNPVKEMPQKAAE
ncbi:HlyC/CorC family transporter [Ponticoccus sp. SC2-23]|uniref:hemolysin family protein n=1 Tax=Alexandriicola marinus TaxID=2081710 RepID=UPI000FDC25D1|nr:hemolysin family protein [Alexandriicola marinus]MBM1222225.1 HlyC/CorC family transporter [Ponticoccus sp. SC6-9]MBM1226912.1 HlyC/CorC family transporter [Ponticoccus sp. SC6-15]MBM1231172.1 HlyC/CorC family transporter [Ponticoccus sp. SC6-38]MBM1235576.1 HlyC/CorC family transporter [Ponticoccus sp. SC6-45]MBM1240194.1 HlyC/CorC family transporter [Ponticoccus sp. SC6-49]MBM1244548.1 HlyC/CorC family transporter [Ponticoccus sp. SC2-64]MBM1249050.1 HlyC/CorC family transporter [Pontic